jgi:hypothetical protein
VVQVEDAAPLPMATGSTVTLWSSFRLVSVMTSEVLSGGRGGQPRAEPARGAATLGVESSVQGTQQPDRGRGWAEGVDLGVDGGGPVAQQDGAAQRQDPLAPGR